MSDDENALTPEARISDYLHRWRRHILITTEEIEATEIADWLTRSTRLESFENALGETVFFRAFDPKAGAAAIQAAMGGDKHADAALRAIARNMLNLRGTVPRALAHYAAAILDMSGPKLRPGRSSMRLRDKRIRTAIRLAIQGGYKATRNPASIDTSEAESACALVNRLLGELGLHLSEKDINRIWLERPRSSKN